MDCELIKEEQVILVKEGDIVIGCGATFAEVLDIIVEHANEYIDGEYKRVDVITELLGTIKD